MKRFFLGMMLTAAIGANAQQQYPGYKSGNYTGVNGVFFNPANIADSRYRWDVNLFGVNAGVGNSNASFKVKTIGDALSNNADSLLFGNGNKTLKGFGNIDILGPSFMFNVNPKTSFAITTRARVLANINELDGQLIQSINDQVSNNPLPYNIASDKNQSIGITGWTDFGVSMGKVLSDKGKHFFKGGITVKYLAGIGNSYTNISKLNGTINQNVAGDYYLTGTNGSLSVGVAGINIDDFSASDALKFNGSGVGADIGFVYEYRPDGDKESSRYQNKYKYKIGVSLLDFGKISYKSDPNYTASYSVNIGAAQQFLLKELDGKSLSEIKTYLDNSPYFTNLGNSSSKYSVALPATIQANIDWSMNRGFYLDLAGQLALHDKDKFKNPFYQNNITLTPRYEGRAFGVYVPANYNSVTGFNAGLSLRAGPLFIGSGSVFTALFDKSKQVDVHFGIRFGSLFSKHKKKEVKEEIKEVVEVIVPKDTDGDGINDENDKCPNTAGIAKYNGCPVPDTDGDGINDENDKCPKVAGLAKYGGCPIPDTDGDGINDENDKCPEVAGIAKYTGCPIPDTDKDGVNDEDDKCPNLAGPVDNYGCPVIKQEVVKKINYAAKNILFQTGKAILLKKSFKQLDEVAAVLKQDENLKLKIEGHTDKTGKADKNQLLSQNRANTVRAYLVKKGVANERLTAVGFGDTMPVADNKTAAGKAKNRRVELKLNY